MNKQQSDLFKQGTLELLVLRLLNSGSLNGWDIMQRIELLSDEVLTVTAGALYPALSAVWRPSDNHRRAKFYGLTAAGRKQLEAQRKQWERFSDAVALVLRDA